jgi:hypothetical protein
MAQRLLEVSELLRSRARCTRIHLGREIERDHDAARSSANRREKAPVPQPTSSALGQFDGTCRRRNPW